MLPSAVMLPTPSVADAMGGHLSRSGARSNELLLPDVAKAITAASPPLLPTPTATPYGRNKTGSPGAAVQPSLDTLATHALLPTPTATDATGARNKTSGRSQGAKPAHSGTTLTDWAWEQQEPTGASTAPPSTAGPASSDEQLQLPPSPEGTDSPD